MRRDLVNKYLDWVEVEYRENENGRANWFIKWTDKPLLSLIKEHHDSYTTLYKMLKLYRKTFWDTFTIDKNDGIVNAKPWWDRNTTIIYFLDKRWKLLFKIKGKTNLRNTFSIQIWNIDEIYSILKRRYIPNMDKVIEEDFYWNQYEVLVD